MLTSSLAAAPGEVPPPASAAEEIRTTLWETYQSTLAQEKNLQSDLLDDLFTPEFDEVFLSEDGKTAMIWIALRDPSGTVLATEPGMLLAKLEESGWRMVFPDDSEWLVTLANFPAEHVPAELSPVPAGVVAKSSQIEAATGYYLPWVAGAKHWLEGSILHFYSFPERGYPSCSKDVCQYAYDFTDGGHFPLVASKDGTVVYSRDSCSDGNTGCTNYILLKDSAGSFYQLYLHLASGTVPDKLTPGTSVKRGQYIGDTDDTGYSTSEHVHFMVINDYWWAGDGYPWGISQDIRFIDVAINGGIPRTCYEVTQLPIFGGATECLGSKSDPLNLNNDWFTSGNTGAFPPTGQLTRPTTGMVVATGTNPLMDVTAATTDDVRVKMAVLLGLMNGTWKEIAPRVTNPDANGVFDWDVNLCDQGPLNGSLQLRLKAWDQEGNVVEVPNITTVTVDHACAPPVSAMTASTTYDSSAAVLNWTATPSASGLSKFELQWRAAGSAWSATQTITLGATARSTWFVGTLGTTYEFRLMAFDNNGQAEAWPAGDAAEQSITFPATCTPDAGESDNTAQTAKPLLVNTVLNRNVCPGGDVDWYRLDTSGWSYYLLSTTPAGVTGATVNLSVYAANGIALLTKITLTG